ncbi:unnamed protein product [Prorocentrum cordatum]|uniref:Uncharacterized protein n=1 Tax=Prorocentrum cordatum TaxID=2364126 RepID=A0ABN9T2T1_9DINO|nr:unnamed protein product [Polarella glacialis]
MKETGPERSLEVVPRRASRGPELAGWRRSAKSWQRVAAHKRRAHELLDRATWLGGLPALRQPRRSNEAVGEASAHKQHFQLDSRGIVKVEPSSPMQPVHASQVQHDSGLAPLLVQLSTSDM